MATFLFGVFDFIAKNKWVQMAIACALAVAVFLGWSKSREMKGAAQQKNKDEAKAQAQIASQTKETNERVEAYHEASAVVLSLPDDELRKRTEADPHNRGLVPRG